MDDLRVTYLPSYGSSEVLNLSEMVPFKIVTDEGKELWVSYCNREDNGEVILGCAENF